MISWLFEIDTINLSTKNVTWNSTNYTGLIIPSSFSGVTMRWDISGNGLIAPGDLSFEVSNVDGTYSTSDFEGGFCTVRLIEDGAETRAWKLKIDTAVEYYGKITCDCVDFLQEYLTGDYPNTREQKEIWPSSDTDENSTDDSCVPVVLGTAYIPVRSVNTGSDRYYVLGESGPTYTVHEVKSPRNWPNTSTWDSSSYDMDGYTNSGYQLLQPIIADSTGDGSADAPGIWRSGDVFYDMLCRFERSDTSSKTNPADWLEYLIEDFGIDVTSNLDATSLAAANSLYNTLGISFPGGGWWGKGSRESILSSVLAQTDSFIIQNEKIELHQFDKTPKETITNALKLSFSSSGITKTSNDSGVVEWPESSSSPSDVLSGKAVVPTYSGGSEDSTSSDTLECNFLAGQSTNAQKAGILYFQKKYEQKARVSFSVSLDSLTNKDTLYPGHVITVNNSLYGGSNNVVITEMTINKDMQVDISGVVLNYLEDWGDLTTTAKSVVTDSSSGFQLATTDYNGDLDVEVDADWDTLLNIPDRFLDTASLGINVTESYMGYYDGSDFSVYIDSSGNMQVGDPNTAQGFVWNQSTGAFTISGSFTIQNLSGVRSDLNVSDGADVTADNPQTASWLTDSGALATLNSINMSYVDDAGDLATVDADALVYYSSTAPGSPSSNPLWGDTSSTPYQLKRYNGSGWDVIATLNTGALADVDSADWSTQISGSGKPSDNADQTTATTIGNAMDGTAVITTGTIRDSGSNMVIDFDDATITVDTANGLIIDGDGSMQLKDSNGTSSNFTADWVYKSYHSGYLHQTQIESTSAVGAQFNLKDYNYTGILGGIFTVGGGVNADSRMTVSASSSYDTGKTFAAFFDGDVRVDGDVIIYDDLYVSQKIIHSGDTDTYIQYESDEIQFHTGGDVLLRLTEGTNNVASIDSRYFYYRYSDTVYLQTSCDGTNLFVYPLNATGKYFGSTGDPWTTVNTVNIRRTNEYNLDVYDDLYELSQIQPKKKKVENEKGELIDEEVVNDKGHPIMDPSKFPLELTNYDEVVMLLKADNGDLITEEDIKDMIQDDDEAGHMLKIDMGLLANLTTGAVRQLDKEVIELFDLLSNRITKLEVNHIKDGKNG